jgi:hypothetical protein
MWQLLSPAARRARIAAEPPRTSPRSGRQQFQGLCLMVPGVQFCNSERLILGDTTSLDFLWSNCRIARPAPSPGHLVVQPLPSLRAGIGEVKRSRFLSHSLVPMEVSKRLHR